MYTYDRACVGISLTYTLVSCSRLLVVEYFLKAENYARHGIYI